MKEEEKKGRKSYFLSIWLRMHSQSELNGVENLVRRQVIKKLNYSSGEHIFKRIFTMAVRSTFQEKVVL